VAANGRQCDCGDKDEKQELHCSRPNTSNRKKATMMRMTRAIIFRQRKVLLGSVVGGSLLAS